MVIAQMTRQMHPLQMIEEDLIVEKELFTEVAPWMWQDFGAFFGARVTMLDVIT